MSSMQNTITTLQPTVNTLITKQAAITGLDKMNNLDKCYNAASVTTEKQPVPPVLG